MPQKVSGKKYANCKELQAKFWNTTFILALAFIACRKTNAEGCLNFE